MCVKYILYHRWFLAVHVWRLTHKWFSTSSLPSRLDICELLHTSALCRCSAGVLVETRLEPRRTEQCFLLLIVSGLFYLTWKRCKIDHFICLGIAEIGCSSQCFYITYQCCIGVTVIDTRAHLPPYYNLTEATHNRIIVCHDPGGCRDYGGEESRPRSFILCNYRAIMEVSSSHEEVIHLSTSEFDRCTADKVRWFADAHPGQQRKNGSRYGHNECTNTPSRSAPKAKLE